MVITQNFIKCYQIYTHKNQKKGKSRAANAIKTYDFTKNQIWIMSTLTCLISPSRLIYQRFTTTTQLLKQMLLISLYTSTSQNLTPISQPLMYIFISQNPRKRSIIAPCPHLLSRYQPPEMRSSGFAA